MVPHKLIAFAFVGAAATVVEGRNQCRPATKSSLTAAPSIVASSSSHGLIVPSSSTEPPALGTPAISTTSASSSTFAPSSISDPSSISASDRISTSDDSSSSAIPSSNPSSSDSSFASLSATATLSLDLSETTTAVISIIPTTSLSSDTSAAVVESTTVISTTTPPAIPAVPTPSNLILNPSFEDEDLSPWSIYIGDAYQSVEESDAQISAHKGSHYLRARITFENGGTGNSMSVVQTVNNLDTTKSYKFSYWIGLGTTREFDEEYAQQNNLGLQIAAYVDEQTKSTLIDNTNQYPLGHWEYQELVFTPSSSTIEVYFEITDNTSEPLDGLIDDVVLTEV